MRGNAEKHGMRYTRLNGEIDGLLDAGFGHR